MVHMDSTDLLTWPYNITIVVKFDHLGGSSLWQGPRDPALIAHITINANLFFVVSSIDQ